MENEPASSIWVDNARLRVPMESNRMSAGYGIFINNGDQDATIVEASSDSIATIEFHESVLVDGIAKMNKLEYLAIDANDQIILRPGAKHLMLFGIKNTEQKEHEINFLRQNGESFSATFRAMADVR